MIKELLTAFSIVAVCLVLHVVSIVFIADWMLDQRDKRKDRMGTFGYMALLIAAFSAIIILHMIEIAIWAGFILRTRSFWISRPPFTFPRPVTPPSDSAMSCCRAPGECWGALRVLPVCCFADYRLRLFSP